MEEDGAFFCSFTTVSVLRVKSMFCFSGEKRALFSYSVPDV